jgi:hypothetical protein
MHTTQAVIARLESGRVKPSTRTLERLAAATGMRLRISFEPAAADLHRHGLPPWTPTPVRKRLEMEHSTRDHSTSKIASAFGSAARYRSCAPISWTAMKSASRLAFSGSLANVAITFWAWAMLKSS